MEPGVSFTTLDPAGDDRFQRLRQELGITSFGLNLLRLGPGARPSVVPPGERQLRLGR